MSRSGKRCVGRLIPIGLFLVVAVSDAAPGPGAAAPESTVATYFEAVRVSDHDRMAALMHPQALEDLRRILLPMAEAEVAEQGGESLRLFADVETLAQLRALDRRQFFASFYKGMMKMVPEMRETMLGSRIEILGHVVEGDSLAHVVYRMRASSSPAAMTKLTAMTVKRTRSRWAVMLTGELQGMVDALKQGSGR